VDFRSQPIAASIDRLGCRLKSVPDTSATDKTVFQRPKSQRRAMGRWNLHLRTDFGIDDRFGTASAPPPVAYARGSDSEQNEWRLGAPFRPVSSFRATLSSLPSRPIAATLKRIAVVGIDDAVVPHLHLPHPNRRISGHRRK
jgi:hypothetical protein